MVGLTTGISLMLCLITELHFSTSGCILLQSTSELQSMYIGTRKFRPQFLGYLNQSFVLRQHKNLLKIKEFKKYAYQSLIMNMGLNITWIEVESEYDLQQFLENGYNVINYTELLNYSFPGGMFKNIIFSTILFSLTGEIQA